MDKAMAYIDKLAAKLGVAAEHVYGVLINQQYTFGIVNVAVGVVSLVIFAALVRLNYLIIAKGESTYRRGEDESFYHKLRGVGDGGLFIVIITVTVAALITGMAATPIGIMQTMNPEYYAIKEILDTIGGK
ncbi:hypothetical protein ABH16_04690 [Bacillus altitudinis]|uniref:hypothetical protein n=1 Tax=Bacillus altitudinis TaxID=293387 RepID=UPI0009385616|nr:hypothetical protein [Bacillus altitudinis]APP15619.1 hypothetical protein BS467_07670 [Bacillus altitudinis]MBG9901826.1 hypothetical protein [Bacillus altitudinis]